MSGVPAFFVSVGFMAMKPVLMHMAKDGGEGLTALPPASFQLGAEALKILLCCVVLSVLRVWGRPVALWTSWTHTLTFSRPAVVYLIMNLLSVRASRMLPPPTFSLLANGKILFTALVAKLVRGQDLTMVQWLALVVLTVGVSLGQWSGGRPNGGSASEEHYLGTLFMIVNCALSALGSVLTENVLKAPESSKLSIYARNVHLAVHSVVSTLVFASSMRLLFGDEVLSVAVLPGTMEWVALLNEATNGIVISFLISHFDSVTKNYAFGLSVFVTAGVSALVLDHRPTWNFYVGAGVSLGSLFMYAHGRAMKKSD